MKRILILGANEKQVQLIQAAKEEGYYVIVCDYTNDHPGIPLADKHYQVSYLDQEAVLSMARHERIDGVIGNNDPAMSVVAFIADQMRLVGNKPESIKKLISKTAFRQLQEHAGLYCPKHFEANDYSTVEMEIDRFDFPIIVKPSVCAGTQGTTKLSDNHSERLRDAFEVCRKLSRNGKVTIEEYVEMPSLEVIEADVFVMGDEILWNGIFSTRRSIMAPMIPMTYIFPAIVTDEEFSAIKKTISKVFREARVRHGEYNIELYFTTKGEVFIIEINPRQGGHRIPQMIRQHTGVDLNKLLVTTSVGDNDYYTSIRNIQGGRNYLTQHVVFSDCSGLLEKIEILSPVKPYVTEIELHKEVGSKVNQRQNGSDYIAYVTLLFPDRETQLAYSREQIEQLIFPVVRPL